MKPLRKQSQNITPQTINWFLFKHILNKKTLNLNKRQLIMLPFIYYNRGCISLA